MRDRKSLYLLIFALLIIAISFVLISIWGYHFYYGNVSKPIPLKAQQEAIKSQKAEVKDSAQSLINSFNRQMEYENDSLATDSSVDKELAFKIIEFNRLKNEISEILRKKSSAREMSEASEKISQLQQSIEELKNKNDTIISENERLNQMVKVLMEEKKIAPTPKKNSTSPKRLSNSAYTLPVLVSHLRFLAYSLSDEKAETNIAAKTERINGSFQVNIKPFNTNTSIYVVVIQPGGKTLLNSSGLSKTFDGPNGKKTYSALVRFDNKKDNGMRLGFSIDSHNFQKGKYVMQVYHQGVMIGRLTRNLF